MRTHRDLIEVRLAGGLVIGEDTGTELAQPHRRLLDPDSRYTIVLDGSGPAFLVRVLERLEDVESGGLPVVVHVHGQGWGSSDLLDRLLERPQVDTVLWYGEVDERVAVIALRPGHMGAPGPNERASELVGQLESTERARALAIDASADRPDIVAAVADLVTWFRPAVTRSAASLVLRWDGAEVGGEHAPAQRLADHWRAVVRVAVVDGGRREVVSFWPRNAALSADTLRAVPSWVAFLDPDRLSNAEDQEWAQRQVDAWLDQLAEQGAAGVPLVLLLVGMSARRSRDLARRVQSRVDARLRGSLPAPPGLVVSLGWGTERAGGWYWTSPVGGGTADMAGDLFARDRHEFVELADAVAHVRARPQAPLDVLGALSDWLAGVPNEWAMAPADSATWPTLVEPRRAATCQRWVAVGGGAGGGGEPLGWAAGRTGGIRGRPPRRGADRYARA